MFGIGGGELIIILLIAFIFIGPDKFPGIAKSFGKGLKNFRDTGSEIKKTIYEEVKTTDVDKMDVISDLQKEILKAKEGIMEEGKEVNEVIENIFEEKNS